MSVVMKLVFSLSLSGSLLILILLLCKPLFKNKLSRQWQYYIWLIVIARLLLPIAPEVSVIGTLFSFMSQVHLNQENQAGQTNAAPSDVSEAEGDAAQTFPMTEDTMIQYRESGPGGGKTAVSEISIKKTMQILLRNLWILWLVIALLLLIRKVTIYQSFVKYIKAGRREVSDTVLLDRLAQIGEQTGVRRPTELYVNNLVSSPLLLGFVHPCIVLPTDDLAEADFTYTVWHELIHYKRRDMFYKWLVQLTICLHWFNPLVWLMGWEINRACEFSCDEAVLGALGGQERRAYGDTLIHALDAGGNYRDFPASVTLSESVELLKERLSAIMLFKKSSKAVTAVSMVLAVALMLGATAMGAYVKPVRTIRIMNVVSRSTSGEQMETEKDNIDDQDSARKISGKSMEMLAERYYDEDMLVQFGAVFSALDASAQKKWLDRFYEDDSIRFFSMAVSVLGSSSPLIGEFAEKMYADGAISYFSILETYMGTDLLKSWQERAKEPDMNISFRSVLWSDDDSSRWFEETEKEDKEQYLEWGITREGDDFYYQGQLVHLFYDKYDAETVIRTVHINPLGTVDVMVTRSIRNKIMSVDYMTDEEVEELFETDILTGLDCEVCRMTTKELPDTVADMITDCDNTTWYRIYAEGRWYIWYGHFAWEYAYQPTYGENGCRIDITRLKKKDSESLLLSLPDDEPVKVYCDGQEIEFVDIGK